MNMSYKQIQAFVKVAQCKNYAEAAEQLYVSQPALSIAIKKLEQEIGGYLLNRSTRKVELTPEGEVFLPTAKRLLHDWEDAYEDLHQLFNKKTGKLAIAAMPSFANGPLPNLLQHFYQIYPNIKVTIQDIVMESVIESVLTNRAEIGFTFESDNMEHLDFTPLFENDFIAICHPQHELAQAKSITWQTLAAWSFISMNRGSTIRQWVEQICKNLKLELDVVLEAGQLSTLGQCVSSGVGVSVVPALCQQQMEQKGLHCVALENSGLKKRVGVITKKNSNLSVAAKSLLDLVQQQKSLLNPSSFNAK